MAIWRKGRKEKRINWIPENYLLASCFLCFILTFLVTKFSEEKPPRRCRGFLGGLAVKSLSAGAGAVRHVRLIPGPGRSPGGGRGSPLQYSCLENPTDRGSWPAVVHGVAELAVTEAT